MGDDIIKLYRFSSHSSVLMKWQLNQYQSTLHSLPPSMSLVLLFVDRNLGANQLSGTIPSIIGSLSNLQSLYEHYLFPASTLSNHSSTLSKLVDVLEFVANSDFQNNQLSGTIPSTIGSLTDLEFLYESHLNLASATAIPA